MSTGRIQLASKGSRRPFFTAPEFTSADHPWSGFLFEESEFYQEPHSGIHFPKSSLVLCTSGNATSYWNFRGVWHAARGEPGSLFITRSDTEIRAGWLSNPCRVMVLQLDAAKLSLIAPDETRAFERSLVSAVVTRDARVTALMQAMRDEAGANCPSGRLYGEGLSMALLSYLAGRYAELRQDNAQLNFSTAQKQRIVEYIQENLASDISVNQLAKLVRMSSSHFARVFKNTFGLTPYRFVMRGRIEQAKHMLESTDQTATYISMTLGFSSQSHFVKVFHEFTGVTPKQYKAGF